MQGTAKSVLQSFRKAFSGEFLSINTGHTLAAEQDYKQLCPGSNTQRQDLKQVIKLETFGTNTWRCWLELRHRRGMFISIANVNLGSG